MTQAEVPASESTSQTHLDPASLATEDKTSPVRDEICEHNDKVPTQYTCSKCQEAINQQFVPFSEEL